MIKIKWKHKKYKRLRLSVLMLNILKVIYKIPITCNIDGKNWTSIKKLKKKLNEYLIKENVNLIWYENS